MTAPIETGSHGERVKLRILEMGLRLWRANPSYVSARRIAHELDMTHGAVLYHFGHTAALVDAIAYHAVREGEARVIVSLIGMQHKAVAHMDDAQRLEHISAARAG
jgi:AcrR family transcriptional regulator